MIPIWPLFKKFGGPIIAASALSWTAATYVAGRNCEEGKLRKEIAALRAHSESVARILSEAEARRAESEKALAANLSAYQKAVRDATANDPKLVECRAAALPPGLRLRSAPPDDPSTR